MKKEEIIIAFKIYIVAVLFTGFITGLTTLEEGTRKINCNEFYLAEVFAPVIPIACALHYRIYP